MAKNKLTEVVLLTKSYNLQDFKDWLKWHLDIVHFDHIVVFDNESNVDIKSICDSDNRIEYHFVEGWPNQYRIYNNYINNESESLWVLPIDDDEFLYVSEKFNNDINIVLKYLEKIDSDLCKISIGWKNLFPKTYVENRLNKHLILNSTVFSDRASDIWQSGNRPVKTFVKTVKTFEWTDRIGHSTHDPLVNGKYKPAKTIDNKDVENGHQFTPTSINADMILFHFQFKCNKEWEFKCKNRKSPGSKIFFKDYPSFYKELYDKRNCLTNCDLLINLWNRYNNDSI